LDIEKKTNPLDASHYAWFQLRAGHDSDSLIHKRPHAGIDNYPG
jgi:hypothetical protein